MRWGLSRVGDARNGLGISGVSSVGLTDVDIDQVGWLEMIRCGRGVCGDVGWKGGSELDVHCIMSECIC